MKTVSCVVIGRAAIACALVLIASAVPFERAIAQPASDLRMVVVLMRHGVRSPTAGTELNEYSAQPWPKWNVPSGYLTKRGALLITQFGRHYRTLYAPAIFPQSGCPAAGTVYVWADVDERTLATADALLAGLAEGCELEVHHASGDKDSLFDPLASYGKIDVAKSEASVLGSLGGDPNALVDAYRPEFESMDAVLGCGTLRRCPRISQVPSTVVSAGGGPAKFKGGLDLASDVAENLLLEYADGQKVVGWGRVDERRLLDLLQLHDLKSTFLLENRYAAQTHSSNVMLHILQTLQQGATGQNVDGTRVPVSARFVVLAAHDTQLSEIAGLLQLSWLMRGYPPNETPPGSAVVFELHGPADASHGSSYVRTFFTAQTMDQMRSANGGSPGRVPVYVPGCPGFDCPLEVFEKVVNSAIDPSFTAPW